MSEIQKLPDSEFEIMMAVWDEDGPVTSEMLLERLHKSWKKPTLLNFLSRLCDRGFLSCEKRGKINVYTPLVKREDYVRRESASFLQKVHLGSLTALVASLYDGRAITDSDLEELEDFIRGARE